MDLSSGSMEKLSLKMGSSEKEEEEDNSVVVKHQVCSPRFYKSTTTATMVWGPKEFGGTKG